MTGRSRHDELRSLAEAATPGPWQTTGPFAVQDVDTGKPVRTGPELWVQIAGADEQSEADAAYIAAVSPDVLLALLDDLAAAEARGTFTRPESAAPSEPELHHAVSDPAPTDGRLTDAGSGSLGAEGAPPPEGTAP